MPIGQDSVTRGVQNLHTVNNEEFKKTATTETNIPKSTFVVRSTVQIPPLTKHPPTEVFKLHVGQKHGGQLFSQTALGNCAVSTARPASNVALSDHNVHQQERVQPWQPEDPSAKPCRDSCRRNWTTALIPPQVRSTLRRRELLGAVEGTNWHGLRPGSNAEAAQVSLRCRMSYFWLKPFGSSTQASLA